MRASFDSLFRAIVPHFKERSRALARASREENEELLLSLAAMDAALRLFEREVETTLDYALSAAIAGRDIQAAVQSLEGWPPHAVVDMKQDLRRITHPLQSYTTYPKTAWKTRATLQSLEKLESDLADWMRSHRASHSSTGILLGGRMGYLTKALNALRDMRERVAAASDQSN